MRPSRRVIIRCIANLDNAFGSITRQAQPLFYAANECPLRPGDVDTSGPPCQDWSSAGLRQGQRGPNFYGLVAWMSWHLQVQTPLIIFENVSGFDVELLTRMAGSYDIFMQRLGPEDVGWPCCRRPRMYVALVNRRKTELVAHPNEMFSRVSVALQQHKLRVRDLLVAPATEIAHELIQLVLQAMQQRKVNQTSVCAQLCLAPMTESSRPRA